MMCLSPSKPFTFPSTTPPAQRPSSCKLSLFIPANAPSSVDCGFTPAPPKQTSTPVRTSRPKLSLKLGSETQRPFASFPPLSLDTSIPAARRPSADLTEEEDQTARNTLANSQLKADGCSSVVPFAPAPCYTLCPGTKSILKKGGVARAPSSSTSCKVVSFGSSPSFIPSPEYDDDSSDVSSADDDTLSPPSTTSSTDSEESESDNEARTPVEEPQSGWMTKRLADKPGFGGGGRWKKAKREWVWTLGETDDVETEGQNFGVKVWGEDLVVV